MQNKKFKRLQEKLIKAHSKECIEEYDKAFLILTQELVEKIAMVARAQNLIKSDAIEDYKQMATLVIYESKAEYNPYKDDFVAFFTRIIHIYVNEKIKEGRLIL